MAVKPANVTSNPGFELYVNTVTNPTFKLLDDIHGRINIPENVSLPEDVVSLVLSHKDERNQDPPLGTQSSRGFVETVNALVLALEHPGFEWQPPEPEVQCVGAACDAYETCQPIYWCVTDQLAGNQETLSDLLECIEAKIPSIETTTWQCLFSIAEWDPSEPTRCSDRAYDLTTEGWQIHKVDESIQSV